MAMLCAACGVGNLIEDTVSGEENLVCEQCGCVSNDKQCKHHQDAETVESSKKPSNYKYSESVHDTTARRKYRLKKYFAEIDHCMKQYSKQNSALGVEAKNLFFNVIENYNLLSQGNKKMRIAGVCTYIVLRQNGFPVNARNICTMMGMPLFKFHSCLNMVKQVSGRRLPNMDIDEVVVSLNDLPILQSREHLLKKAVTIANFLKQISIVDGRTPRKLAYLSAYLAFVSEEKKGKCTAMSRFAAMNDVGQGRSSLGMNEALNAFKERLFILIKRLPWMQNKAVKEHSYHLLIDDLLRYKDMLLKDYKESGVKEAEMETVTMPLSFLRSPKTTEPRNTDFPIASTSQDITEDDIPEAEMASYLRTSEEIEEANCIQNRMAESIL